MLTVVHFCAKDGHLAIKNLNFVIHLEESVPLDALLAYDSETPKPMVETVRKLATSYFRSVKEHEYFPPHTKGWPQAPNHAFQQVAYHIITLDIDGWFWWEADAVPVRKGWLTDIDAEYKVALSQGKTFMGHHVQGIVPGGHMNGVGVYPRDVGKHAVNAMLALNAAWDVSMASQMLKYLHPANHLFQHCWSLDDNGAPSNGGRHEVTFKSWYDVAEGPHRVDFRCATFHRCKDGSIIDQYMNRIAVQAVADHISKWAPPATPLPLEFDEPKKKRRRSANPSQRPRPPSTYVRPDRPGVRIMIVTHFRDFDWLKYSLASIRKFATGFEKTLVCFPEADAKMFADMDFPAGDLLLHMYDELPGKGMLQHMVKMGFADCIRKTPNFVLHMDADCIIQEPITPDDYFVDGKPVYVVRSYQSLIGENGVVSDCYQWKSRAEEALGEPVDMYTMCRHPTGFPYEFYKPYRQHIGKVHQMRFDDYVLSKQNSFPQGFAEFPTMGAYAWKYMHDKFHWIDVEKDGAPKDKMKTYWSHARPDQKMPSGLTARQEIEEVLK